MGEQLLATHGLPRYGQAMSAGGLACLQHVNRFWAAAVQVMGGRFRSVMPSDLSQVGVATRAQLCTGAQEATPCKLWRVGILPAS